MRDGKKMGDVKAGQGSRDAESTPAHDPYEEQITFGKERMKRSKNYSPPPAKRPKTKQEKEMMSRILGTIPKGHNK